MNWAPPAKEAPFSLSRPPARVDSGLDEIEVRTLAAESGRRLFRCGDIARGTPSRLLRAYGRFVIPAAAETRRFKLAGIRLNMILRAGVDADPCRKFVDRRRPLRVIRVHCRRSVRILVSLLFQHMRRACVPCNMIKRKSHHRQNFVQFAFLLLCAATHPQSKHESCR